MINSLFNSLVDGAHCDDDLLSVFCAIVVEQLVICAELRIDLVHVLLDYCGHCVVSGVAGLTGLEEQVGVLSAAHLARVCRVQAVSAELCDCLVVDQLVEIVIIPDLDLLDFVRCTESVEEVDEGKFALNCCAVSDGSQIHDFLYAGLTEHSAAGLSCGVYVGVIAEDVQSVCTYAASCYVDDCRKAFAGDLVKVGDHQKKTLGSCKGGCHRTGSDRAVHSTCSTSLGLHLGNLYGLTENVLASGCSPLINMLRHYG